MLGGLGRERFDPGNDRDARAQFRRQDLQAFVGSGLLLVGMLTNVAFGMFPNVLHYES
jgi:hypothetical protein